jgi:hypothetical protein
MKLLIKRLMDAWLMSSLSYMEPLQTFKYDCFAFRPGSGTKISHCHCLNVFYTSFFDQKTHSMEMGDCFGCPFYKTKEQNERDLKKYGGNQYQRGSMA